MSNRNKALVQSFIDAVNRRDLEAALGMVAPDLVSHAAIPEAQGASGLQRTLEKLLVAFPDLSWKAEEMIAEGDRVACRLSERGTHTGKLEFVRFPLPASGKAFTTESIQIYRFEDGKVVEHWGARDVLGMMRQLGHLPAMGAQP